jgi:hypothetical protein
MKEDESMPKMFHRLSACQWSQSTWRRGEGQGLLPQVLEMLTIKIWHIGHYSSEEWFGHHDTKLSVGRCDD